nr:unnamed protein product [Callosobruchus analis]
MAFVKFFVAIFAAVLALATAVPVPGGYHHKHVKIIVPHYVHTHNVHHHHVKTVHVPVPVIKKVYVHEEPHIIHHDHHDHHDWW